MWHLDSFGCSTLRIDEFGMIHQAEFTPITYDKQYISLAHGPFRPDDQAQITQRLGWILRLMERIQISAGNRLWHRHLIEGGDITGVADCAGYDVQNIRCRPARQTSVDWEAALDSEWDVVAMFDDARTRPRPRLARRRPKYGARRSIATIATRRARRKMVPRLAHAAAQ